MDETSTCCALCGEKAELRGSHVLPAFVFRWSKATSITGYLRFGKNPRLRQQDGLKVPMLCASCEARFNAWETRFATDIFHPYNANSGLRASYGDWMLKFCVSVSWRVLKYMTLEYGLAKWSPIQQAAAARALEQWRAFMFDEIESPGLHEQHLLPFDVIGDSNIADMPPNINRYLTRMIEMDLVCGRDTAFVYSKMGRFVLFGMVMPPRVPWKGTRVHVRSGTLQPGNFELPIELRDYLFDRARRASEIAAKIPEHQADKIEKAFMRDPDRVANSDQFAAMRADAEMFGVDSVIRKRTRPT